MTIQPSGAVSNEAIHTATTKTWVEWIAILDSAGLQDTPHKDIVLWLKANKYVGEDCPASDWWGQSIVVGYEYHHGRRVIGQTVDAGFEVGVQRTINASPKVVWQFLVSPEGVALWLGKVKGGLTLELKAHFETESGIRGEIRTVQSGRKLRLVLQETTESSTSTLQITLMPNSTNKTQLNFHNEKLAGPDARDAAREKWLQALTAIQAAIVE